MAIGDDELGAHYPLKGFGESYAFLDAVGSVRGLRLIDVTRGAGCYSRQLRDAGAAAGGGRFADAREGQPVSAVSP